MIRVADDFDAIRTRMDKLKAASASETICDPADCVSHDFDPLTHRCQHCNLHYYHLPSQQS